MNFDLLKRNWEAFGRDDPLWAVLTEPSRKGGGWDPDEFFATGERRSRSCWRSSTGSASPSIAVARWTSVAAPDA